jgi:hypothetical protein
MTFHLADGVGIGERGERGGISGQRAALRRLAEEEEFVSKGSRLINRQAVTQRRPFGCLLAAQFESEFLPFRGLVGRRGGNTLERFPEILTVAKWTR